MLDLLRLHRALPKDLTIEDARRAFRWLNDCRVIAYSRKAKTVRSLPPEGEAAVAGESPSLAAMISPRTPFSNVARLRRLLRQLVGTVTWADPHFGARALEELASELDPERVQSLHILSGSGDNVLTTRSFKEFTRFQEELQTKGIVSEWRVDPSRDWHDRWLTDSASLLEHATSKQSVPGRYEDFRKRLRRQSRVVIQVDRTNRVSLGLPEMRPPQTHLRVLGRPCSAAGGVL